MFSRNPKPTGKRPPSAQGAVSRTSDEVASSGSSMPFGRPPSNASVPPPIVAAAPRPSALPSIPRVASQYGAHGPVSMSELERKLASFGLDQDGNMSPERQGYSHQKSRLETIQDTEAALTGAARPSIMSHGFGMNTAQAHPRATSSNFSRPMQQSPSPNEALQVPRPLEGPSPVPTLPPPDPSIRVVAGTGHVSSSPPKILSHAEPVQAPRDAAPPVSNPAVKPAPVKIPPLQAAPVRATPVQLPPRPAPLFEAPHGQFAAAPAPPAQGPPTQHPAAQAPPARVRSDQVPPIQFAPDSFPSRQAFLSSQTTPAQIPPIQATSAQTLVDPPRSKPLILMPPPPPRTSTVPTPPQRQPPPPPFAQPVPLGWRPSTAPADPAPFAVPPEPRPAEAPSQRPSSRGLSLFRPRSRDSTQARNNHELPPRPPQLPRNYTMPAGPIAEEPFAHRPSTAKWSSSDSAASTIAAPTTLAGAKPAKTVRSRFNPMSLITRRKTGHSSQPPAAEPLSPPLPVDFDPRIRGSLVHDFSAPRVKSGFQGAPGSAGSGQPWPSSFGHEDIANGSLQPPPKRPSPDGQPRTPVFKEHFGDDTEAFRLNESDRRNRDTTGIAHRVPDELPNEAMSLLPVFARKTPSNAFQSAPPGPPPHGPPPPPPQGPLPPPPGPPPLPPRGAPPATLEAAQAQQSPQTVIPAPQIKLSGQQGGESMRSEKKFGSPIDSPRTPPHQTGSRSPSVAGSGSLLAPTPARLKSNASSRFSFDLAGAKNQEKLLEEKHRQRNAQKARESIVSGVSIVETDDEDNGYDDMDLDGMDEDIPGMDSDEEGEWPTMGKVSDFALPPSPSAAAARPGLNNSFSLSMPIQLPQTSHENNGEETPAEPSTEFAQANIDKETPHDDAYQKRWEEAPLQMDRGNFVDGDDLYFDDGMIGVDEDEQTEHFDESVFDDENSTVYGIPLRDQKQSSTEPTQAAPGAQPEALHSDSSQPSTRPMSLDSAALAPNNAKATADTSRTSVQPHDATSTTRKAPTLDTIPQGSDAMVSLTQDNLAAYHDALAFAATKAAKEGRFERKQSVDENLSGNDAGGRNRAVSFNDRELGPGMQPMDDDHVLDDFDFDDLDDLADDAIIAEANAEALENDEDDFYGSEFGFYAQGSGSGAERVHGGYFGSGFNDMVKRSLSGRGMDPSLTPITERSEWSQRNSMISLAMQHGGSYSAAPTPGLAQLATHDSLHEDDSMSLSALMKLRRGAFGDSTTSLPSSAGSHKSSSPSGVVQFPLPPPLGPVPHPPRTSSSSSLAAAAAMPPPERPASASRFAHSSLSPANPSPLMQHAGPASPQPMFPGRPVSKGATGTSSHLGAGWHQRNPSGGSAAGHHRSGSSGAPGTGHSRTSSYGAGTGHSRTSSGGSESVTYMQEFGENGGAGRWVMERRRTSEAGEVQILGREVLEGQRI